MSAAAVGERAFLGISGKSAATTLPPPGDDVCRSRINKFKLQRAAQKLLPEESVNKCLRHSKDRSINPGVDVLFNPQTGKAGFGNLITCGSTWHCPVCGAKITEGRRLELMGGTVSHQARGGQVLMMTLTYPHEIDLPLDESLKNQAKALSKLKALRKYKLVMKKLGSKGSVRALETTHGVNGWHPHTHDLVFCDGNEKLGFDALEELETLRDLWGKCVFKVFGAQINEHGFKVNNGDYAAEYIAKFGHETKGWNVSHEMTKSHSKKGAKGNRTPFDLLRDYIAGDFKAGELFKEYAKCFKGKRQLYYSPGLKEYLAIEDKTDEELAEGQEEIKESEVIGVLNQQDWQTVLRNNARGELLVVAERYGWEGVRWLIARLSGLVGTDDHWYFEHRVFSFLGSR